VRSTGLHATSIGQAPSRRAHAGDGASPDSAARRIVSRDSRVSRSIAPMGTIVRGAAPGSSTRLLRVKTTERVCTHRLSAPPGEIA
jgi:hypothetical protein